MDEEVKMVLIDFDDTCTKKGQNSWVKLNKAMGVDAETDLALFNAHYNGLLRQTLAQNFGMAL